MLRIALAGVGIASAVVAIALATDPLGRDGGDVRDGVRSSGPPPVHVAAASTDYRFISNQGVRRLLARKLIGRSVADARGDPIGRIQDLIITPEGRVDGVVVAYGGIFGIGSRQVALALDGPGLSLADGRSKTVLSVGLTAKELNRAPAFNSDEAPKL